MLEPFRFIVFGEYRNSLRQIQKIHTTDQERAFAVLPDTPSWCPIEAVNWDQLAPTYPFRFNGPGYLYCMWCAHYVCLVLVSTAEAKCSECGQDLAVNNREESMEAF